MTQSSATTGVGISSPSLDASTNVTRAMLWCGAVAGPVFILVVVIQLITRTGFDLGRHPISLLSLGGLGWIQITDFVIAGVLAVAFAIGIRRVLHPSRGGTWGPWLVGTYGLGLITAGIFVPDPENGFPPGTPNGIPETYSTTGTLHGIGFMLAIGSLTLACFVLARRYAAFKQRGWAIYSIGTAVVAFALSAWPSRSGASVRYFAAAALFWAWQSAIAAQLRTQRPARLGKGTTS